MNVSFHIVALSAFKLNWKQLTFYIVNCQGLRLNMTIYVQVQLFIARAASSCFTREMCVKFFINV